MSAKAIDEATGKNLLNKHLEQGVAAPARFAEVTAATDWDALVANHPWLSSQVTGSSVRFLLLTCSVVFN